MEDFGGTVTALCLAYQHRQQQVTHWIKEFQQIVDEDGPAKVAEHEQNGNADAAKEARDVIESAKQLIQDASAEKTLLDTGLLEAQEAKKQHQPTVELLEVSQ